MKDWDYPFARPHSWDSHDETWYAHYLELKKYKEEFGHCRVPYKWARNVFLGSWVKTQRSKKLLMVSWRRELLDQLGFTWQIAAKRKTWEESYQLLVAFYQQYGHCRVKRKEVAYASLRNWVAVQRAKYRKGLLGADQITALNQIGFIWRLAEEPVDWAVYYEKLKLFKHQHGHCDVVRSYQDKKLAYWVKEQRRRRKEGNMSAKRIELLEGIGFKWQIDIWSLRYELLKEFKQLYGHCKVPKTTREARWKQLASWVCLQRKQYANNQLNESKIRQLNQLGFSWNAREEIWQGYYKQLQDFYNTYGHCQVNLEPNTDQMLKYWVTYQQKHRTNLSEDKIEKLDLLGFVWSQKGPTFLELRWNTSFKQLVAFKQKHGHCNVPRKGEYIQLSNWVTTLRQFYKNHKLSQNRIDLLNSIGFEWSRLGKR